MSVFTWPGWKETTAIECCSSSAEKQTAAMLAAALETRYEVHLKKKYK